MRRRWIAFGMFGLSLAPGGAPAQMTPATPTRPSPTPSTAGAFGRLSPANQQIARALYEAQHPGTPSGSAIQQPGATARFTPVTLDQIAAKRLAGKGWSEVFKEMQAQGLIREKSLGRVIRKVVRAHLERPGSSKTPTTAGSGRTQGVSGRGTPEETGSRGDDGRGSGARGSVAVGSGSGYVGPGGGHNR